MKKEYRDFIHGCAFVLNMIFFVIVLNLLTDSFGVTNESVDYGGWLEYAKIFFCIAVAGSSFFLVGFFVGGVAWIFEKFGINPYA
ncbi:hypothetical protein [Chitiniphilus eburneus]|uniref:Uncharacterized protein n=1 Tax=Chitiniphilus eburneus TaxID=2571148 RepID=A0A4U0Q5A1_9NEIS|nr:hypothetical protein [Chitiniphilus eburneus]TJZ76337.1 hypothetical protein FAZ21_06075 [Chitiniphilus eburneus]